MSRFPVFLYGFFILLIADSPIAFAQLYGSNTIELQAGNLPFAESRDLTTSYNQLNLFYDSGNISLFGKAESFLSPVSARSFTQFTQKRLQFQDDQLRIRIGNFYETLGRGLLLRSYDIPGSVYEDAFNRTRYAFFRDLEGIAVDVNTQRFQFKALRASPLNNLLPPNFEPDSLRRPDLAEAIQANFYANSALNIGLIYMRTNGGTGDYREFISSILEANISSNIQFFGEYAFESDQAFSFKQDKDSFAFYSGINAFIGSLGGSLEFKNYQNFRLGNGFNDPPSLIKEHTYPVLNRSTHVLNTSSETGFQAEMYYNFEAGHAVTVNVTQAQIGGFIDTRYFEFFTEALVQVNPYSSVKVFFDYANDELKTEEDRWSFGVISDKSFQRALNLILDLQYQQFERTIDFRKTHNFYSAFSAAFGSEIVLSAVFEASTDPQLTDNPTTFPQEESNTRFWPGLNALYKFNPTNTLEIFAGKRRGGPACTSGICYEILDFEGAELRLTTRF